jgi:hypothetical protein
LENQSLAHQEAIHRRTALISPSDSASPYARFVFRDGFLFFDFSYDGFLFFEVKCECGPGGPGGAGWPASPAAAAQDTRVEPVSLRETGTSPVALMARFRRDEPLPTT